MNLLFVSIRGQVINLNCVEAVVSDNGVDSRVLLKSGHSAFFPGIKPELLISEVVKNLDEARLGTIQKATGTHN